MHALTIPHDFPNDLFAAPPVLQPPPINTTRLAIAGCGVVGTSLVRELSARSAHFAAQWHTRYQIVALLVRDARKQRHECIDESLITTDVDAFVAVDADVVIEAIGGLHPARRIVQHALRRGARVITANKALVAECGQELSILALEHGGSLRFDAAVGGGVPVLRLIEDALGAGRPTHIRAILNGTTNYVLTQVESGEQFDVAIENARTAGFAEADASRDLDGRDAADKLALISWSAFGVAPEDSQVHRRSFLPDPGRYSRLASRYGGVIRQIAECRERDGQVVSVVEPVIVPADSQFAATRGEQNRVDVHTGWNAPLSASGPGAGGDPTAIAMISDLLAVQAPALRACTGFAAEDEAAYDWAIEIHGSPLLLHHCAPPSGIVHTDARAEHAWTTCSGFTRAQIGSVLAELSARSCEPIAARLDDDIAAGCR